MRNLVRLGLVLGGVVLSAGAGSVLVVGCGGDDTVVGGPDAHADATGDATGIDTGTGDGGTTDAPGDAPLVFDANFPDYTHQINVAFCTRLAACCGASTFDIAACVTAEDAPANLGVANQAPIAPFLDGGHLTFNRTKANDCLNKVGNIACGAVSSAFITDMIQTCLAGAVGNIPTNGTGCRGSAECAPPNHCVLANDAGTCVAPQSAGTACGNANEFEGHAQCGSLVTGVPGFCDTAANNFGGTNACQPQRVDGGCFEGVECQTNLCGAPTDPALIDAGVGQCVGQIVVASADLCTAFPIVDAGTD